MSFSTYYIRELKIRHRFPMNGVHFEDAHESRLAFMTREAFFQTFEEKSPAAQKLFRALDTDRSRFAPGEMTSDSHIRIMERRWGTVTPAFECDVRHLLKSASTQIYRDEQGLAYNLDVIYRVRDGYCPSQSVWAAIMMTHMARCVWSIFPDSDESTETVLSAQIAPAPQEVFDKAHNGLLEEISDVLEVANFIPSADGQPGDLCSEYRGSTGVYVSKAQNEAWVLLWNFFRVELPPVVSAKEENEMPSIVNFGAWS